VVDAEEDLEVPAHFTRLEAMSNFGTIASSYKLIVNIARV